MLVVALIICAAFAIAACDQSALGTVEQLVLGGDCVDPRDFGAVVNDGIDDMAAIQAAIDAALASSRPVCLPTGTLHITKRPGTGLANIASLTVSGDGLTIYGQGDYSRISLLGGAAGDWWLDPALFFVTGVAVQGAIGHTPHAIPLADDPALSFGAWTLQALSGTFAGGFKLSNAAGYALR